ncbi:MAG: class I SAM-dependent methyltransferase [Kitasatospora sp.]|nr:class I SAM-dependent methyltransferase [Kitasatospora sp.]
MGARDEQPRDDLWVRRSSSFGSQAAAYAEHRPDYAEAAVEWAVGPVRDRGRLRVLDMGAGTGKLTAMIARLASPPDVSVVAVEPDPAMLAELRSSLPGVTAPPGRFGVTAPPGQAEGISPPARPLVTALPDQAEDIPPLGQPLVTALPGRAEDIPLPDASMDAVLCGQAAHWFTMDLAVPEIARVLTPGGVFAGLWNMVDDREDWVAGLCRVCPQSATWSGWTGEPRDWPGSANASAFFAPADRAEFEHVRPRTADSLVATIATHSRQLVMNPEERGQQLDRVRDYLLSRPETARGEFHMPMLTGVLRSVKI